MNGLELIRATLAEWRRNRGNETTFYKCQHFDGWYVQWALQGFRDEGNIRIYSTAQLAADASPMFTRRINDKAIQAGDRLYFRFNRPGHIVTAIGWDGDRLLVSDTANGGDTVIALTNNVTIRHADTVPLQFIGASRQNGTNRGIRVANYIHGQKPGTPAGGNSRPIEEDDDMAWLDEKIPGTNIQYKQAFRDLYWQNTKGVATVKHHGENVQMLKEIHAAANRADAQSRSNAAAIKALADVISKQSGGVVKSADIIKVVKESTDAGVKAALKGAEITLEVKE